MNIPAARIENFVVPEKDEHGRACMKQVWLDVENERLIATNGHMAARVSIGVTSDDVTGVVPVEAFELARKELKVISKILGKDTVPDPQLKVTAGQDAVIVANLLTNTTHIVNRKKLHENDKYPNTDAVFPKLKSKPTVTVDSDYLAGIINGLDGIPLSIWVDSDDKAIQLASESGHVSVVLMPMRSGLEYQKVNERGATKRKSQKSDADDTTVSMGYTDEDGKQQWTPAIPVSEFTKACDSIANGEV